MDKAEKCEFNEVSFGLMHILDKRETNFRISRSGDHGDPGATSQVQPGSDLLGCRQCCRRRAVLLLVEGTAIWCSGTLVLSIYSTIALTRLGYLERKQLLREDSERVRLIYGTRRDYPRVFLHGRPTLSNLRRLKSLLSRLLGFCHAFGKPRSISSGGDMGNPVRDLPTRSCFRSLVPWCAS
jgi:hypothetical protein